jgi:hypothetical protein
MPGGRHFRPAVAARPSDGNSLLTVDGSDLESARAPFGPLLTPRLTTACLRVPSDLDDNNQGLRHMNHAALGLAPAQRAAPGAPAICQTAVDRDIEGRAVLNSAVLAHNPEVAGSKPLQVSAILRLRFGSCQGLMNHAAGEIVSPS